MMNDVLTELVQRYFSPLPKRFSRLSGSGTVTLYDKKKKTRTY